MGPVERLEALLSESRKRAAPARAQASADRDDSEQAGLSADDGAPLHREQRAQALGSLQRNTASTASDTSTGRRIIGGSDESKPVEPEGASIESCISTPNRSEGEPTLMHDAVLANHEWDCLLRAEPPSLESVFVWQEAHDLASERPLCQVARPSFVTQEAWERDRQVAEGISALLRRLADRVVQHPGLRQRYLGRWWDERDEYLRLPCGHRQLSVFGRLDAFRTEHGLRFLEYNALPGGLGLLDMAGELFRSFEIFRRFCERWDVSARPIMPAQVQAILRAYHEWGGEEPSTLAVLLPLRVLENKLRRVEMDSVRRTIEATGLRVRIVDPDELSFEQGRLRHGDFELKLVIRSHFPWEDPRYGRGLAALAAAVRAHAVCLVNPFSCHGHKALFAVATDPEHSALLDASEQSLVRQHLPWTRLLRDSKTTDPAGQPIDLLTWAAGHRGDLVLKPAVGYGGTGVILGWEVDAETWAQGLAHAVAQQTGHVIQERVVQQPSSWPLFAPGLPVAHLTADCCPILASGQMVGYLTRLGRHGSTNVAAGGSFVPTFVLE